MRLRSAALASFALALLTASPALAGAGHGHPERPDGAAATAKLMQAADRFDARASAMRARAARLRASALELRSEAEALSTDDGASTDPAESLARMGGHDEIEPETSFDPCDSPHDDESLGRRGNHHGPDHDGDDAGGTDSGDGGDHGDDPFAEVCELLETAARFEFRADALDTAAERMAGHATKLREKASTLLQSAGKGDADRLLAKARKLRADAQKFRDRADALRDRAFDGTDVDEDAVSAVQHFETKAATYDKAADRLEARAAAAAAS